MSDQAWVDLDKEDFRGMLINLIGDRFGPRPEEHLDQIRNERARYAMRFIKMAGVRQTQIVLDLGSGCGFGTATIARHASEVIACDISPAYLEYARRECNELGNIQFHAITNHDLSPVDDHSVDVVISMAVFIHLNLYDIYQYFEEFSRVLKPGGKVLIDFADMNRLFSSIPNRSQNQQFLSHAKFYREDPSTLAELVQWNSARGIKGIARSLGFKFVKRRGHKLMFRV
jgi:ubiquinone/menaquinone biosynthesis C-methylase UbiE